MKQSPPSIASLEAFVAVVDHGGFTAAARALGTSKVALSRAVTALERDLGEQLLLRTTRTLRLTEAGSVARARAGEVIERAHSLMSAVAATSAGPAAGELRVVATQVLYDLLLEPIVVPFMKRNPAVTLRLAIATEPLAPPAGQFDLALLVGPAPDSNLGSLLIGKAKLGIYASPEYLEKRGQPTSPDDLADHAVVAIGRGTARISWTFTKGSRTAVVPLRPRLVIASHDLAMRAAARGAGITRLPTYLVARGGGATGLARILEGWSIPEVPAYAVFPGRERPPPPVRAFLDLMKERLRAAR